MKELSTTILDKARELVTGLEHGYYTLAVLMVKIKNEELYKEAGYETWVDYYEQDLKREKTTVSRLLTCGEYIIQHGLEKRLHAGNIPYKRLATAITAFPDKPAEHVVSVAESWDENDFKQEAREVCDHPKPAISVCPDCFKRM